MLGHTHLRAHVLQGSLAPRPTPCLHPAASSRVAVSGAKSSDPSFTAFQAEAGHTVSKTYFPERVTRGTEAEPCQLRQLGL